MGRTSRRFDSAAPSNAVSSAVGTALAGTKSKSVVSCAIFTGASPACRTCSLVISAASKVENGAVNGETARTIIAAAKNLASRVESTVRARSGAIMGSGSGAFKRSAKAPPQVRRALGPDYLGFRGGEGLDAPGHHRHFCRNRSGTSTRLSLFARCRRPPNMPRLGTATLLSTSPLA